MSGALRTGLGLFSENLHVPPLDKRPFFCYNMPWALFLTTRNALSKARLIYDRVQDSIMA